ncbi:MAG: reverse transcriptase family protein [Candidatus Magnetoglobus multicellularis str. Araruama]|uniref:Reverse transcriptase family protein n=1 Tax=Candidatus Magnetoglobus multicellularis str. Araruama TaxID=890399 RepID=A0A1V1NZ00_9BACT|nr:MAG: reverse transcriptase family protein [Candidatus Magnetoglobus multicellularis str. Araruama]
MNRVNNLYIQVSDYENICLAFIKAAKGKQNSKAVAAFKRSFDENIAKLQIQIRQQTLEVGEYHFFHIWDPKPRFICAAKFPERILHHAIMNICEPVLERYAIDDSYACRKYKGSRKAIDRAQQFARRFKWFLKLDIKKYFDSIDHAISLHLLNKRIKDKQILDLFSQILKTYHTRQGKGLPIGNLISQHLANFYLGYYDHWIKENRRIKGYLRYMDDFVLFGDHRSFLKNELAETQFFLNKELALEIKPNIQLNRCTHGIPFLGYRVFPNKILLSPRSKQRFHKKFRAYEAKWKTGRWTMDQLIAHMEPLIDFTRVAQAKEFRKTIIHRFGVSS